MTNDVGEVTRLLADLRSGDKQALDRLIQVMYPELKRIAAGYLRKERPGHTLQPTALVHEAYERLAKQDDPGHDRSHFCAIASQLMRRILVDHARKKRRKKRQGEGVRVEFDEAFMAPTRQDAQLVALDDALKALAVDDPRLVAIVEMKFFGGLTNQEIARQVGVSVATIEREWAAARARLRVELSHGGEASG
jgi:RNA polymerase sigma factor (TIGR02999 family)